MYAGLDLFRRLDFTPWIEPFITKNHKQNKKSFSEHFEATTFSDKDESNKESIFRFFCSSNRIVFKRFGDICQKPFSALSD
jgi:hypothetical protein